MNGIGGEVFRRMDRLELGICGLCNRACQRREIERFFALISRLGDGVFWYALMTTILVVGGRPAVPAALHMALVGAVSLALYKLLKPRLVRHRPYLRDTSIRLGTVPLDRYSFPSGHTLHAVAFSLVAVSYYPALAFLVVPFATLVAASRLVLGLHYPSDVLAGAALGAGVALASFSIG